MYIAHDGPADEHILDRTEVRVLEVVDDGDVFELDVEKLVDRFQGARDLNVVLEFHGDRVVDEGFEKTVHRRKGKVTRRISRSSRRS